MTTALDAPRVTPIGLRSAGLACLAAGLVGAAFAVGLLAWPEQVSEERFSYPLTATGHTVVQVVFALQHVPLVLAALALHALPAVRGSRVARWGTHAFVVGMVGLTVMEVVAISAGSAALDSTLASTVGALYGLPTLLAGVGATAVGVALVRGGGRDVGRPVLVTGIWVFVPMTPVLASGDFVLARLAIGGWMLVFAWFGLALARSTRAG